MPANLDQLQSFLGAITGERLALKGPDGRVELETANLRDAIAELVDLRTAAAEAEELAQGEGAWAAEVAGELADYVNLLGEMTLEELPEAAVIVRRLAAIVDRTAGHPPELLAAVASALRNSEGDEVTKAEAVLDLISAWVERQDEQPTELEQVGERPTLAEGAGGVEQLLEALAEPGAPGPRLVPATADVPRFVPDLVHREPAPITLETERAIREQVLGMRRGARGRYDAGNLDGDVEEG